jgi:hypothetical protein
MEKWNGIDDFL